MNSIENKHEYSKETRPNNISQKPYYALQKTCAFRLCTYIFASVHLGDNAALQK